MELEKLIKANLPNTRSEWIWFILLMFVVVTLGLIAVNNYLAISYKATLIQAPCNLCDNYIIQRDNYLRMGLANLTIGETNISILPLV